MGPYLDYRTLFLASGIVGSALLMLMAMQARRPYPGLMRVIVGLDALTAAIVIADLRGYAPDALFSIQLTALGTFALVNSGVRLFCETPRRGQWPYIYVPATMLLQTYFYFTRPLHQRIILTSLLSIPIFVDTAVPLLSDPPPGRRFGYRFTAIVSVVGCVAACFRIVAVWSHENDSPYFLANPANTTFFLLTLFLLLCMAFGFITLSHEKLVAELSVAHEERARVERQLEKSERMAAVGKLAGGIAHFFNNQMCAVQLACSLMRDSLRTVGISTAPVEEIDKACKRSSKITTRLLLFAQSKALRLTRCNPLMLLDNILPELRTAAGDKIEVTMSSSSKIPLVEVDAEMLKETVFALVENARDAMPSGGKLTISLQEEELDPARANQLSIAPGAFVLLSVADTGTGMDDETLRHVFEPFFTTKGMAKSEGLGLSSAYGFARQSGGTITVSSAPQRGSTFELYLPKAPTARR